MHRFMVIFVLFWFACGCEAIAPTPPYYRVEKTPEGRKVVVHLEGGETQEINIPIDTEGVGGGTMSMTNSTQDMEGNLLNEVKWSYVVEKKEFKVDSVKVGNTVVPEK